MYIALIILNIVAFISCIVFIPKYMHIFQLKDYQWVRYLKYFSIFYLVFAIFNVFFVVFELFFKNLLLCLIVNLILFITNLFTSRRIITAKKTPLNYTNRMKRMITIGILLAIIPITFVFAIPLLNILIIASPIIANILNIYDRIKNHYFIKTARLKIKKSNAKIIAITGSNGKTSVKNILLKILSKKYTTLATPKSYNTPLGISKFINESLTDTTQYLILEYGARRRNDVMKLCRLFGADFGIVTMVAGQHLESFHTIENIYKTKSELPKFLNKKMCVFNMDNEYTKKMYNEKPHEKLAISIIDKADIFASNIIINNGQTTFDLHYQDSVYTLTTKLLGKHNITNIALASALSLYLGISADEIIKSVAELEFVPHRLELIKTHINILDDSYNCSIASAKEAIDVLTSFDGKKMVVTPGIIEGGRDEYSINFRLGELISKSDFIVIVGEHNKKAIEDGLITKNVCKEKILYAIDLTIAKQYFSLLNNNDTLLLLNDLPDDYN